MQKKEFEFVQLPDIKNCENITKMNDIEDALQYYVALHHNINYFISNDKQLKKEGLTTLPVVKPSDYIKEFLQ